MSLNSSPSTSTYPTTLCSLMYDSDENRRRSYRKDPKDRLYVPADFNEVDQLLPRCRFGPKWGSNPSSMDLDQMLREQLEAMRVDALEFDLFPHLDDARVETPYSTPKESFSPVPHKVLGQSSSELTHESPEIKLASPEKLVTIGDLNFSPGSPETTMEKWRFFATHKSITKRKAKSKKKRNVLGNGRWRRNIWVMEKIRQTWSSCYKGAGSEDINLNEVPMEEVQLLEKKNQNKKKSMCWQCVACGRV